MNTIEIRDISKKYFSTNTPQNYKGASTTIGSGTNGVVTVTATNDVTTNKKIKAVVATGNNKAMSATISDAGLITVTLGTDASGSADDTKNTAKLIATAINALEGVTATASGTGATAISSAVTEKSFTAGQLGTPCAIVGTCFKSGTTYYVATDTTINTTTNTGWKSFTLSDLT